MKNTEADCPSGVPISPSPDAQSASLNQTQPGLHSFNPCCTRSSLLFLIFPFLVFALVQQYLVVRFSGALHTRFHRPKRLSRPPSSLGPPSTHLCNITTISVLGQASLSLLVWTSSDEVGPSGCPRGSPCVVDLRPALRSCASGLQLEYKSNCCQPDRLLGKMGQSYLSSVAIQLAVSFLQLVP